MGQTEQTGAEVELLSPRFMRQLDRLVVVSRRSRVGVLEGQRRSPRHGQSVEFADFRPYAPGDDLRQVDWNAYARLERFFLRLFVSEEDTTVHILLDASRSMRWGEPSKLLFALRLAAAIGYVALGTDWLAVSPYSSRLEGYPRPLRGRAATGRLLGLLAAVVADGQTDLQVAMRHHLAAVRRRGPMLVLSDLYDPGCRAALRTALGAGHDLTVIHILSPEELEPELEGDWRLIDDETGEMVEISAEGDTLALYRRQLESWRTDLAAWCARRGILYVPVDTRFPLSDFVLGLLRRRGVVG